MVLPFPIVTFREKEGVFSFTAGDFSFYGGKPVLLVGKRSYSPKNWRRVKEKKEPDSFVGSTSHGKWHFTIENTPENIVFSLSIDLKKPLKDFSLLYMEEGKIPRVHHIASIGMRPGQRTLFLPDGKEKKEFSAMNVLFTFQGREMFFSYPLAQDWLPESSGLFTGGKVKGLSSGVHIHNSLLTHIAAPALTVSFGDGFKLLSAYGERNTAEKKSFPAKSPCGWNSWDYYRWTITEEAVLKNAEFIASDPVLSKHVKRIVIDDGWQYCYGEWAANSLFPSGMETVAKILKKMGFTPGLWIAPFVVEPHARIAQTGYDMLARTENGLPGIFFNCMERRGFLLDPTLEKTRRFWHDLFKRYAAMGYDYFKLDFLSPIYQVPRFANDIPRGRLTDLMFSTVREAIGKEKEIMACGYLPGCGSRYIDAARIGSDIHAVWGCIKANTPSLAAFFWADRKLWINDPDFALCRTVDSGTDKNINLLRPCLCYIRPENDKMAFYNWKLVENHFEEARVLLSLVLASGGAVNLSDCMMALDERELDLARKTVSAEAGESAVPLDLFSCDMLPEKWLQKTLSGHRLLLINWSDETKEMTMDLASMGLSGRKVRDFWEEKPLPVKNGKITVVLAPHCALFAEIR